MRAVALLLVAALPGLAGAQPPRLDAYGDPLPEGAIARIGTIRLRPGAPVTDMAFTPDGKHLVTVASTHQIHVWEVATGRELRAVRMDDQAELTTLAPDGRHIATVDSLGICRVRRVTNGAEIFCFIGERISCVRFSPDGRVLAVLQYDHGLT